MRVARLTDPAALQAGTLTGARLDYGRGNLAQYGTPAIVAAADPATGTTYAPTAAPGGTLSGGWTTFGGANSYPTGALGGDPFGLTELGGGGPFQAGTTAYVQTSTPGQTFTLVTTAARVEINWITVALGGLAHVTIDTQPVKGWDASQAGPQPWFADLDGQQHTIVVTHKGDATIGQIMLGAVTDTSGTGLAAALGFTRNGQPTQALTWTVAAVSASAVGVYTQSLQAAPSSAPTGTPSGTGGSVPAGNHTYLTTFTNPTGETAAGTASGTVTTSGSTSSVALASIPTGPAGTTGRKVYRSDGGAYGLVLTLADNTTTTGTDTAASLGAAPPSPGTALAPVGALATGKSSDALVAGFTVSLKTGTWTSTCKATVVTSAPSMTIGAVRLYTGLVTSASYAGPILDSGATDTEWPLLEFAEGPLPTAPFYGQGVYGDGIYGADTDQSPLPAITRGAGNNPTPDATWTWQTPTYAVWADPAGGDFQRVAAATPGLVGRYCQTLATFAGLSSTWVSDIAAFYWRPAVDPFRRRFNPAIYFGEAVTVPLIAALAAVEARMVQDALDFNAGNAVATATGSYLAALGAQWDTLRLPGEATAAYQGRLALAQQGIFEGGGQRWLAAVLAGAFGCPVGVSPFPRATSGGITFPTTFPGVFAKNAAGYWRWCVTVPFAQLQVSPEQAAAVVAQVRPVGSIASLLFQ